MRTSSSHSCWKKFRCRYVLVTVSCTGCSPVAPGTAKRLPTSKSTRMLSFLRPSSKAMPAMNQGELIESAASKIFSVTTARPFAMGTAQTVPHGKENDRCSDGDAPVGAQPPRCARPAPLRASSRMARLGAASGYALRGHPCSPPPHAAPITHSEINRGFNKNLKLAARYGNPIKIGIPAVVLLDADQRILYSSKGGELA